MVLLRVLAPSEFRLGEALPEPPATLPSCPSLPNHDELTLSKSTATEELF